MNKNNGSNNWGVAFSHITWFQRLLVTHGNVTNIDRHDDVIFEVDRVRQSDHLTILCCSEYTMSLTLVQKALAEFGDLNIIHIGGGWNSYTYDAKDFCFSRHTGLYASPEITGALWKNEFWSYEKPNTD
jgi:hypothetical protein